MVPPDRELDPAEFAEWDKAYQSAKTAMAERTDKLDQVAESIERDLIVLGATAIEDKLQQVHLFSLSHSYSSKFLFPLSSTRTHTLTHACTHKLTHILTTEHKHAQAYKQSHTRTMKERTIMEIAATRVEKLHEQG